MKALTDKQTDRQIIYASDLSMRGGGGIKKEKKKKKLTVTRASY